MRSVYGCVFRISGVQRSPPGTFSIDVASAGSMKSGNPALTPVSYAGTPLTKLHAQRSSNWHSSDRSECAWNFSYFSRFHGAVLSQFVEALF
jgi:hypothetical protein